jgi:hypothetical protein
MREQEVKLSDLLSIDDITEYKDGPGDDPTCQGGLIFRGHKSTFFDGKQLGEKKSLRLLKRRSCKCPECSFVLDSLKEYDFSCTTSFLNDVEEGDLFTLKPYIESDYDYESSWGDTYVSDFTLVKIKE